ncbi:response regulator [Runella sp.]|uniref:response regulator n=1 Tax=Runella sp. TaxID=1960881 RepID=UPI003D132FE3
MENSVTFFLIDDDTDDQEIFLIALEGISETIECKYANDGIRALEKLNVDESFVPDYIFLDMNMPRMNGKECLVEIRKIERLKHVPTYIYSTSVDPRMVAEVKQLGATDVIIKPTSIKALSDILENLIAEN